jgi:uncharacterized lipoprotein YmbA
VTRKWLWLAALLGTAALAGCGSSPVTHFYTLHPAAEPAAAGAGGKAAYTVAIGAVALPDGVDRPQIVLRGGGNQVQFSEFERWVGALKDEIALAVAANLKQGLGGATVSAYPVRAGADADVNVLLHVQRFDSALGDAATVEILWQVIPAKGAVKSGLSTVREPAGGPGYDALVAAHVRALAAVSRDIAAAIRSTRVP